ncbi:MAG: acyl-CoA dehydrogenase [Dehalococcoidia bacterium]|nr:acyl-CoA dehydrogenase [Dehalococcoidia bacterium]
MQVVYSSRSLRNTHMDFGFTPEQQAFRQEIRDFLAKEIPPDWCGRHFTWINEEEWRQARAFDRKLAARGWLTLAWPKEYGGQGRSHIEQLIFLEEMGYHHAPNGGGWSHGPVFVGPTIMHYGSLEQKRRFLPPISRGEEIWCQGFSEPDAGSDLASLQTRAVRDGDEYVLSGEKHFVGQGHRSEWCIVAARTDPHAPKHRGLSMFLLHMRTPGVTVNPMHTLPRYGAQWQILLDNARVPASHLVGEENRGFYQMMSTMDFERNRIDHAAETARVIDDLAAYAGTRGLSANAVLRHKLAEMAVEARVAILLNYRIAWQLNAGKIPNYEASIAKLVTERARQRAAALGMEVLGLHSQLAIGDSRSPDGGKLSDLYLAMVSVTIVGGTSEIQRNVIAQRGLGLPRG